MTTATTTTVIDHTSDAGFRTWGTEFNAQLTAIGLTNTTDTGQINWTTVTRAAANTAAGYEIWRFTDTLQATTPIFMKIEYGTGYSANFPQIWITVGQGSSGAGAITGVTSSRFNAGYTSLAYVPPAITVTTAYVSRFCYNTTLGFFGFVWKLNGYVTNCDLASAFVFRSNDSTGAPTATSVSLLSTSTAGAVNTSSYSGMQTLNYGTGLIYPPATVTMTQGSWWSTHPFALLATSVGTNINIDPAFYLNPGNNVSVCMGRALLSEVGMGVSVSATLVGSTAYNYIQVGSPTCNYISVAPATGNCYAGGDLVLPALTCTVLGRLMLWQ